MMAALFLVRNQRSESSAKDLPRNLTLEYCKKVYVHKNVLLLQSRNSLSCILLLDCRQLDATWSSYFIDHRHSILQYFILHVVTKSKSKSDSAFKCIHLVRKWYLEQSVTICLSVFIFFLVTVHFSGGLPSLFCCISLPLDLRTLSKAKSCLTLLTLNQKGKMCLYCPIIARTSGE